MITEDYVSFETAKLLKEKGFNIPCHATYDTAVTGGKPRFSQYEVLNYFPRGMKNTDNKFDMVISAPTHQMAMKWLREVHNINIDIVSVWNQKRFEYQVFVVTPENAKHCYIDEKLYLVYEQACEEAIKYCLEI